MSEATAATRSEGHRRPLTRNAVVRGGLRLIDTEGLDALSMRRLGGKLGVEAMSLYNHVANKDDLLDAVVEFLWGEVASNVDVTGIWQEDVRGFARAVHRIALDHPNAYPLMLNRGVLPAAGLRLAGELVASLRVAGFADRVGDAVRTVVGYVAGYTMAEVAWYGDPAAATAATARPQPKGDVDPELRRMLLECDTEVQFAVGLEVLLDGLDRLRDSAG